MFSKKVIFVPWGYFGYGNIGDEAMLIGFYNLLKFFKLNNFSPLILVSSQKPRFTKKIIPNFIYLPDKNKNIKKILAFITANTYLILGDTPITDILYPWPIKNLSRIYKIGIMLKKPIYALGIGTESLSNPEALKIVQEIILPATLFWSVRSEKDKQRLMFLKALEEKIQVTADLVWLLKHPYKKPSVIKKDLIKKYFKKNFNLPVIGINLTNEKFLKIKNPYLFKELTNFCEYLLEKKYKIVFFMNEIRENKSFDKSASLKIYNMLSPVYQKNVEILPNYYFSPYELFSILKEFSFIITMRYHACIFSSLLDIPFIAIERSEKISDLCEDIGWQHKTSLESCNFENLKSIFEDMERKSTILKKTLETINKSMYERALRNKIILEKVFKNEK